LGVHAVDGLRPVPGAFAEAVFVEERTGLLLEGVAEARGCVGAVGVQGFVAADQLRMVVRKPGHEPLLDPWAQVQHQRRDTGGAGVGELTEEVIQLLGRIGQPR
jgi:hypothetical protein